MINNKQVNLWRGDDFPPTIYHVWIYKEQKILLYNGTEWVVFIDDVDIIDKLNKLQEQVNAIEETVNDVKDSTINSKLIIENPVLTGEDLLLNMNGHFINGEQTITRGVKTLDSMFHTLIIE